METNSQQLVSNIRNCKLFHNGFCFNRGRHYIIYDGKIPKKITKEGIKLNNNSICRNCLECENGK